jgi:multiple sugar transport system permease protein
MADTRLSAAAVPGSDTETVRARPGAISRSVVIYLVAVTFVGFCLLPFYVMITTALKREGDIFAWPPVFLFEPTLDSIRAAFFGGRSVIPYLVNSAAIAALSTVLATALGSMAAFGLSRFRFRGSASLSFWILSTRMAPPVAFLVPMFIIFRNLGMIDTHLALVVIYTSMNLSFVTWVLIGFFREIPVELEEAALMDGYTYWQYFRRIALPLVRPGLAATAILSAIFAWNEFLFALILTSKRAATIPIYLAGFSESMGIKWGEFMAVGCFAVIPIMIFTLALQKHLVRGLTFGAVK